MTALPISLTQLSSGLESLDKFDFTSALAALQSGNVQGDLTTLEGVADFLSDFFPPAVYAKDGLIVLSLILKMYNMGLWRPVTPDDLMYQREFDPKRGGK